MFDGQIHTLLIAEILNIRHNLINIASSSPEGFSSHIPSERRIEVLKRFHVLFEWMIVEGIVDPANGIEFEVSQLNLEGVGSIDPETTRHVIERKFLFHIGLAYNPIDRAISIMEDGLVGN